MLLPHCIVSVSIVSKYYMHCKCIVWHSASQCLLVHQLIAEEYAIPECLIARHGVAILTAA